MKRRRSANRAMFYSEVSEPMLPTITTPIARVALPRESWISRALRAIGAFISAIIRKVNQLLALALAVLLLLLFTRFILYFFHFSSSSGSSFVYWVFFLSPPLGTPFRNLFPTLPYNGHTLYILVPIALSAIPMW